MMDHADTGRQGALDGRGNLSRRALVEFTAWFLRACVGQVGSMAALCDPDGLAARLRAHVVRDGRFPPEAASVLAEATLRGGMTRADAERASGLGRRAAPALVAALVEDGLLASDAPDGPVRPRFPTRAAGALFPGLLPLA